MIRKVSVSYQISQQGKKAKYHRENQRIKQKLGRKRERNNRRKCQQEEKYRATAVRLKRKPGHTVRWSHGEDREMHSFIVSQLVSHSFTQ